jgi:hypothetical protein
MKTIELTNQNGKQIFVIVDKIFAITEKEGGSFIKSLKGDVVNVQQSPSEINEMINKL